jgi:hypothetical protein
MENLFNSEDFSIELKNKIEQQKKKKNKEIKNEVKDIDYNVFFRDKIQLSKLKLDELKFLCKKNKLKFSGTKKVLSDRIEELFKKTKPAVKIQSNYRRWLVTTSMKLRGPALKKRDLCVNDTDFVTMEPITEIPNELFFSYQDNKKFVYGFNISSLIKVLQKNLKAINKIENPYNREMIDGRITLQILKLYRISFIVYPDFNKDNEKHVESQFAFPRTMPLINRTVTPVNHFRNTENIMFAEYEPIIVGNYQMSDDQYTRLNRLREIRNMNMNQRINNLFIEIDHLGNYTQSLWFNELTRGEYIILYRFLYDIWYYRLNFARETRYNICPYLTPFYNVVNVRNIPNNLTIDEIKQLCLIAIENLVYTGYDDEHRKLGAMHALSALTVVSLGARITLPWLYESVMF